jgi:hypothetical protein
LKRRTSLNTSYLEKILRGFRNRRTYNKGPNTEPCGIPDVTSFQSDVDPLIDTLCVLPSLRLKRTPKEWKKATKSAIF